MVKLEYSRYNAITKWMGLQQYLDFLEVGKMKTRGEWKNNVNGRRWKFMRWYLIDVDDVSLTMAWEILHATCELRWDFLEEERMMQYSRDKYSAQLRTKVINPVGEPHNTSLAVPTHKITNTCTKREQGVVNPLAVNYKDQIS